jgi:hypothetical protein
MTKLMQRGREHIISENHQDSGGSTGKATIPIENIALARDMHTLTSSVKREARNRSTAHRIEGTQATKTGIVSCVRESSGGRRCVSQGVGE